MKKTLAIILVAVMLLSTLVSLVVPAYAEEEAGIWDVMLQAPYSEWEDTTKIPPLPGYYYDESGFHTIAPNYDNFNAKFSVVGTEQYNIQDFTMTVVIYDYCTAGDNWLSFSVWSEANGFAQGGTTGEWGDGWTSLIRSDSATGALNRFESWNQTIGGRQNKQQFTNIDGTQTAPVVFDEIITDDGGRMFTFAIEGGVVKINGKTVGTGTDNCISKRFPEGLAYVGVTVHNTDGTGTYRPTVSVIDVNGEVPTGSDSREAEDKTRKFGDPIDPDTVPKGQPALWFDATDTSHSNGKRPTVASCTADYAEDNMSYVITAENSAFAVQWDVPDEITHEASAFTYMLVLFKNFCTCALGEGETPATSCMDAENTSIRYCAGEVTAPNNDCFQAGGAMLDLTPRDEDGNPLIEDKYSAILVPIVHEKYTGRIHTLRVDIGGYNAFGEDGKNTFEILGCGVFRGPGEVIDFVSDFRGLELDITTLVINFNDCEADGCIDLDADGYCDACWMEMCVHVDENGDNVCDLCGEELEVEPPVGGEDETDATTEDTSEKVDEDTSEKPVENKTEANDNAGTSDDSADKGGCGSVVSMGALAIVAILGTGLVIKKKED